MLRGSGGQRWELNLRGREVRSDRRRECSRRAVAVAVSALVLISGAAVAEAAPGPPGALPSLRLFGSERVATDSQGELRFGFMDLGLWVSASGGSFQLDVRRPNYGPWVTSQVDPTTGQPLRRVPPRLVNPLAGLDRFLNVRVVNARGRVVLQRIVAFCPGNESARVDGTGPMNPTYEAGCRVGSFPFVRGTVWGIDAGWAAPVAPGPTAPVPVGAVKSLPPCPYTRHFPGAINLKPGRYTATVTIADAYRRLLAIPARDAVVTVQLRVTPTRVPRKPPHGCGVPVPLRPGGHRVVAASVSQPDPATMPNLAALPAWAIRLREDHRHHDLLMFNATIWNAGPAPFTIEGYRRAASSAMQAFEYFYDSAGDVVGRAPAGTMSYDNRDGHHHWHVRQLATYTLIGASGRVIHSQKQSFCIAPTDQVDLTLPGAALNPNEFGGLGFAGGACDLYDPAAIWIREQLPVGWGDTYQQYVAGQAFDVTHLPNGNYRIEVRVNPLGVLHETSTSDDQAFRAIRITGSRNARRVAVAPWHGING